MILLQRRGEIETKTLCKTLRDRQNFLKILERKAELAVRGEKLGQQRYEAEADVEVKYWGRRNSDFVLYEVPIHRNNLYSLEELGGGEGRTAELERVTRAGVPGHSTGVLGVVVGHTEGPVSAGCD